MKTLFPHAKKHKKYFQDKKKKSPFQVCDITMTVFHVTKMHTIGVHGHVNAHY